MDKNWRASIGVKATYFISCDKQGADDGECGASAKITTREFNGTNTPEAQVGLPVGSEPVKPQPGDVTYSGMHDQGPLPDLKEGGPIALLLGCVAAAKDFNNDYLTDIIHEEKKHSHPVETAPGGPRKKGKTEED
jgi:hypothetical protein